MGSQDRIGQGETSPRFLAIVGASRAGPPTALLAKGAKRGDHSHDDQ